MSFFAMAFMVFPFGSFAGTLAGIIGPRGTILLGAACCLVGTVLFAKHLPHFKEKVRPIYVKMGLIREVAEWMETAAPKTDIWLNPREIG